MQTTEGLKAATKLPVGVAHFDQLPDSALIGIDAVAALASCGVSTLYRWLKTDPNPPTPFHLSQRCTRYPAGEVRRWLKARSEAATPVAMPKRGSKRTAA